ncbi:MAG: laccase domain-containing protein, partial [Terracidiphilus sp.]
MRASNPANPFPKQEIQAIDALLAQAGMTRSLRGKAGGVTTRMRFERLDRQELTPAAPVPRLAPNGVEWIAVPGWERLDWLWHGFSTRRGGRSTAYRAEGAPGELNLGFTADDAREAVLGNRRLLADAITGGGDTPLIALKQIHSNLTRVVGTSDVHCQRPWKADGMMTGEPGLLLAIQTADCIPVLVADRKRRAVA